MAARRKTAAAYRIGYRGVMDLPREWSWVRIGDICEVATGGTPSTDHPEYYGGDIRWLKSGDVKGPWIANVPNRITDLGVKNSNARVHPAGTVMLAMSGQGKTRGMSAILKVPSSCSQSVAAILPSGKALPELIHYTLTNGYEDIRRITGDEDRTGLNLELVGALELALPPLEEQRKIAAILSAVDDNIQKTQQVIDKTEELKKGLVQQLLTRGIGHTKFKDTEIGEIPEEWQALPIRKLCRVRRGASPRPIGDPKYFADAGRGWVRIEDVTPVFKYLRSTSQYLSPDGVAKSVPVNPGDLIMSICATIGKPIIVDMAACIHDGFVLFHDLPASIDRDFFFYVLQSKEQVFASQRQTGTQGNLNTSIVGATVVPVPGLNEQRQIAAIFSELDERLVLERQRRADIEQLKHGLMQVLLTGKVRVKPDARVSA